MDYSYNYGYLKQFMESHKLAKKDLLEALGCNDYVSLNKWLDGKVPVHITALLRLCNYYNEPLCNFFVDGDGMPCDFAPLMPDTSAQIVPINDYGIKDGRGRGIVETRITSRQVTSAAQMRTVAEGLQTQAEQRNKRDAALSSMGASLNELADGISPNKSQDQNEGMQLTETVLRMQLDHSNEIRQMEQAHRQKEDEIRLKFDRERDRLMTIIEQQSKEIARLSSSTSSARMKAYNQGDNNQINLVSESEADIQ